MGELDVWIHVFLTSSLVGRSDDPAEDQDVGGWITLRWILERWDGVMWTGLIWLRIGTGGELL
jgi:hypothetical protein